MTINLAPELPIVWMDFVLMQQALANLLSNAALAYARPGREGPESMRGWRGMMLLDRWRIAAGGIDPKSLAQMFDKFYRGPGAPTGGTGLGLSSSKGFVEALQGGASQRRKTAPAAERCLRSTPAAG